MRYKVPLTSVLKKASLFESSARICQDRGANAPELLPAVYVGVRYVDGVQQRTIVRKEIAA